MIKTFIQQFFLMSLLLTPFSELQAELFDPSASVFRFQKKMAERGDIASQFKLGLMYETGSGVDANLENARLWYKKAAEHNYKPAQNRLTYLEIKQSGFKEKHQQWLKELKNDARFNEGEALFLLGQMYAEGTGVSKSLTRSIKLLRKASAANIPGSESEMLRVENELIELQEQYLNEEEKKRVAPIAIIPARPASENKIKTVQPDRKQTSTHTTKVSSGKIATKPVKKPPVKITGTHAENKATRTTNPQTPANITKTSPVAAQNRNNAQPAPEKSHPVDTICSGRNLFSSGCR